MAQFPENQVHTSRLRLVPFTENWVAAIQEGSQAFLALTGYRLPQPYTEFPESFQALRTALDKEKPVFPWTSYALLWEPEKTYVGQGGFKGKPDVDGGVEIGYEIAKGFRSMGFAHEAIGALVRLAFEQEKVRQVYAHTLPVLNASNHLLIKNKFVFDSTVTDEEDGQVWKWVLRKTVFLLSVE